MRRAARRRGAAEGGQGLVDHPLGHHPVGGELAAGDGDHPGRAGPHLVAAGDVGGRLALFADQGTHAGPGRGHVGAGQGGHAEAARRGGQQIVGVRRRDRRPGADLGLEGVGGPQIGRLARRHGEDAAPIGRGHHDGPPTWQGTRERTRWMAGWPGRRAGAFQGANGVHPGTGGVDDQAGAHPGRGAQPRRAGPRPPRPPRPGRRPPGLWSRPGRPLRLRREPRRLHIGQGQAGVVGEIFRIDLRPGQPLGLHRRLAPGQFGHRPNCAAGPATAPSL